MTERYDPDKDAVNQRKHGLPLLFGDRIFEDPEHVITPTIREEDGEDRYKVIGVVEGKHYTAVIVWRDQQPRYISVRRSQSSEQRLYGARSQGHRDPGGPE